MGNHPHLQQWIERDLETYLQRDFASQDYVGVLMHSRGFQAAVAYRMAHVLLKEGHSFTAKWLSCRIADVYAIDIHPAAEIGSGLVIDHGQGLVIGETASIGDNVFLFHNVTLGGTGRVGGDRHPKVGSNVVIGAGATLLGNIKVGDHAVIAAGAVVLKDVPPGSTVAGIPAKLKGKANKIQ